MLIKMKRAYFCSLNALPLIWACIEPTIKKIRGQNSTVKRDVYQQLTDGQQALLMFQILYGHTLHGVEEFILYHSYMLSDKGMFSQMINGMNHFGAFEAVRFLNELFCTYQDFSSYIEMHRESLADIKENARLVESIEKLDKQLKEILPDTIHRISLYIKNNTQQFVELED